MRSSPPYPLWLALGALLGCSETHRDGSIVGDASMSQDGDIDANASPASDAAGEQDAHFPDAADAGTRDATSDQRDASCLQTVYEDRDGDGLGRHLDGVETCAPRTGWVANALDCDDSNPAVGETDLKACPACQRYRKDGSCILSCQRAPCLERPECDADPAPEDLDCDCPQGTVDVHGNGSICARAVQWSKSFGGPDGDHPSGFIRDREGNLWVSGELHYDDPFYTLPGMTFPDVAKPRFLAFVAKLTSEGQILWAHAYNVGGALQTFQNLTEHPDGTVWWAGNFNDFAELGEPPLTGASTDIFVVQFAPDGTILQRRVLGGPGYQTVLSLIHADEHWWLSGRFAGTLNFSADQAPAHDLVSVGEADGFVAQFDADWNHLWSTALGGLGDDGFFLASDRKGGVWLAGIATGPFAWEELHWDFASNQTLAMLAHVDSNHVKSVPLMAEPIEGLSVDSGFWDLDLDSQGNIWLTGSVGGHGSWMSTPTPGGFVLGGERIEVAGGGYRRMLVVKTDPEGAPLLVRSYGEGLDGPDLFRQANGEDVAVAPDDSVWVIGPANCIDGFNGQGEDTPTLGLGGLGLAHFASDGKLLHSLRAGHTVGHDFVIPGPQDQIWITGGFSRDLDLSFGLPNEDARTMSVMSKYREMNRGNVYIGHMRF